MTQCIIFIRETTIETNKIEKNWNYIISEILILQLQMY